MMKIFPVQTTMNNGVLSFFGTELIVEAAEAIATWMARTMLLANIMVRKRTVCYFFLFLIIGFLTLITNHSSMLPM
jgi:diacylglycerol kinase family enzyme